MEQRAQINVFPLFFFVVLLTDEIEEDPSPRSAEKRAIDVGNQPGGGLKNV
jgi:hypothetical protein